MFYKKDRGNTVPIVPSISNPVFEEGMINNLRKLGMKRQEIVGQLMQVLSKVGGDSKESNY